MYNSHQYYRENVLKYVLLYEDLRKTLIGEGETKSIDVKQQKDRCIYVEQLLDNILSFL